MYPSIHAFSIKKVSREGGWDSWESYVSRKNGAKNKHREDMSPRGQKGRQER